MIYIYIHFCISQQFLNSYQVLITSRLSRPILNFNTRLLLTTDFLGLKISFAIINQVYIYSFGILDTTLHDKVCQ